jgi:hypothetical protein
MIKDFARTLEMLRDYSHDIHRLNEGSTQEGKDERQVLEMGGDGYDQGSGGGEK